MRADTSAYLCSVLFQSGRACRAAKPAKDCKGKRALTAARFQQMQPGPMPSSAAAAGGKPDEEPEPTTDESSSFEMSFTAPQVQRPSSGLQRKHKKTKAAPKDGEHPKGPAKRAERPPSPKQPPKKKAKQAKRVPETAAAPKVAPAKLEVPAVVPLNVHDRRRDQLATIKGKTTEAPSMVFKLRSGGEIWIHQAALPPGGLASVLHGRDRRRGRGSDPRWCPLGAIPRCLRV